jgi:chromosome segregation ATPase
MKDRYDRDLADGERKHEQQVQQPTNRIGELECVLADLDTRNERTMTESIAQREAVLNARNKSIEQELAASEAAHETYVATTTKRARELERKLNTSNATGQEFETQLEILRAQLSAAHVQAETTKSAH